MKKVNTILIVLNFLVCLQVLAQAPQKMSYQAVIRNASNALVINKSIGMKISVLQGSETGTVAYAETQTTTTNANGLASIQIGGGTPTTATFTDINWANGPYFIKTETDPNGGTAYSITGNSQLLSVPYALYAANGVKSQTILHKSETFTSSINFTVPQGIKIIFFEFFGTIGGNGSTLIIRNSSCQSIYSGSGGGGGISSTIKGQILVNEGDILNVVIGNNGVDSPSIEYGSCDPDAGSSTVFASNGGNGDVSKLGINNTDLLFLSGGEGGQGGNKPGRFNTITNGKAGVNGQFNKSATFDSYPVIIYSDSNSSINQKLILKY